MVHSENIEPKDEAKVSKVVSHMRSLKNKHCIFDISHMQYGKQKKQNRGCEPHFSFAQ